MLEAEGPLKAWVTRLQLHAALTRACRDQRLAGQTPIVLLRCPTGSQEHLGGERSWGEGRAGSAGLQVCSGERITGVMGSTQGESGSTEEWVNAAVVCAVSAFTCLNSCPPYLPFQVPAVSRDQKQMSPPSAVSLEGQW